MVVAQWFTIGAVAFSFGVSEAVFLFLLHLSLYISSKTSIIFSTTFLFAWCTQYRYFGTAQLMLNGFLTTQGIPKHAHFDPHRPSESIANLLDLVAREHLHTKLSTIVYVKPAVTYVRDLVKLGKARGLLQKFNATELSDQLTDTLNLEVTFSLTIHST